MIQAREAEWVLDTVSHAEVKRVPVLGTALHVLRKPTFWSVPCEVFKKLLDIKIGREENKHSFNSMKSMGDQKGILKGQMGK